ncbi:hypothetical protein Hanom_Chr16g01510061 [Helianthus anomalus]
MYKPKNLLFNTFMHKNNITKINKARASYLKKPQKSAFLALCGKSASNALRR